MEIKNDNSVGILSSKNVLIILAVIVTILLINL